eukprot:GEMP01047369.1.p1 GENE.GEMP01047369.1~~GEMP01047369.1.p1  ORF type:complete len:416 (+),score=66.97 GEMP01047369.1:255-1502(+)
MAFRSVFGEFKLLFTELGDVAKLKQKVARVAIPTITATTVTTGALYYHKHFANVERPEVGARLQPVLELHARVSLPPDRKDDIRAAVLRGCPIEQDCISAVRGSDTVPFTMDGLVDMWQNAGYFHDPTKDRDEIGELFQDPNSVSTYGKDINSTAATQRAFSDDTDSFMTWDAASISKGLDILDDIGYLVVNQAVTPELIHSIRHTLEVPQFHQRSGKGDNNFEVRNYVGPSIACDMIKPSPGRRHFLVRNTEYEELLAPLMEGVVPLVQAYLSKHRGSKKPYLSELQIAVTEPLAVQQFWHRDNLTPGLTCIVPLMAVPPSLGQTGLLPYSHNANVNSVVGETTTVLNAGDMLIYDGRLLHRGKRNLTYNKTRIVVVFRYDFEPPPGQGVVITAWNAILGNVLHAVGWLHNKLP